MDKKDCKTFRVQLEEADLQQQLNADTLQHLRGCRSCHEFYATELKLRQLIAGLPGAEAPADFDFRLRARIKSDGVRPRFSLSAFGVPSFAAAAVILLVGGVVLVRNGVFTQRPSPTTSQVASPVRSTSIPPAPAKSDVTAQDHSQSNLIKTESAASGRKAVNRNFVAVDKRPLISKDSSSVGAKSIRQDAAVAGIPLTLSFPMQRLSVSVDDGSGVAHTISFPTVSFGSERVLTRPGNSFQGVSKSDW